MDVYVLCGRTGGEVSAVGWVGWVGSMSLQLLATLVRMSMLDTDRKKSHARGQADGVAIHSRLRQLLPTAHMIDLL